MAIISGLSEWLAVGKFDLSGDTGSLSAISSSRNLQDITGLRNPALRRLGLVKDGHLDFSAFFDAVTGQSYPVLSALPGVSTLATWSTGSTVGMVTASLQALQATYDSIRGQDGSLVLNTSLMGDQTGLEWGQILTTGKQTIASAAVGTSVDGTSSTSFGLAAYLHAISIGSGTATVAIQDSADNSSFANVTGGVFTNVTAATSQRIQTSTTGTVRRYVRVNVTNTFTNLVCFVTFTRFLVSVNS